MREEAKVFLIGFAEYLKSRNVEYHMHQDFSVNLTNPVIGYHYILVQYSFDGKPYIHDYIGECFAKADEVEEFEEELEKEYPDYKFYADRYG